MKLNKKLFLGAMLLSSIALSTSSVMAENTQYPLGDIDDGFRVPSVNEDKEYMPKSRALLLPNTYNSVTNGYVTSVKNQNPYGTCWTFGALSACESSYIKKYGYSNSDVDFSELNLAYFFYHSPLDPLGLTDGDKVSYLGEGYLDAGGNKTRTCACLANWVGETNESVAPYSLAQNYENTLSNYSRSQLTKLAFNDQAHLQNSEWISCKDTDIIKSKIMEYGSGAVSFYWTGDGFNSSTDAFYQNSMSTTNHCVCVVGWDNDYPVENFNSDKRPSKPGAWLVKNSWGTNWGDDGYFWLSYEDTSFSDVYFFDVEPSNNYDNNYQYDGSYYVSTVYRWKEISTANVFTTQKDSEVLKAVSFYNVGSCASADFTISIYKDLTDPQDPTSGTLVDVMNKNCDYLGYYTVPLNEKLILTKGTTFSVVVHSQTEDDCVGYAVDTSTSYDSRSYVSSAKPGQSFVTDFSNNWEDIGAKSNQNCRIKAFTDTLSDTPSEIKVHYYSKQGNSNIYYWNTDESGDTPVTWPGVAMTSENDNWYTYTLSNISSANIIFSNQDGTNQTEDLYQTSGEWWYVNGSWYDEKPIDIKLHYKSEWGKTNVYYWNVNNSGNVPLTWPGVAMTNEGDNWYTYTIPNVNSANVIFANSSGSAQTKNLECSLGEWWYYDNQWHKKFTKGTSR